MIFQESFYFLESFSFWLGSDGDWGQKLKRLIYDLTGSILKKFLSRTQCPFSFDVNNGKALILYDSKT